MTGDSKKIKKWVVVGYGLAIPLVIAILIAGMMGLRGVFFAIDAKMPVAISDFLWVFPWLIVVACGMAIYFIIRHISKILHSSKRLQELEENELINEESAHIRKNILKELQESQDRIRDILEFAPIGMIIAHPDGQIDFANGVLCDFLGYPKEELEQMNLNDIIHPDDRDLLAENMKELLDGDKHNNAREARYLTKDNQAIWGRMTLSMHEDSSGKKFFINPVEDITERKKNEEKIRQLAFYDSLTGLCNRYSFIAQIEQVISQSRRDQSKFALLFIDLDRFKIVNDTFGHKVGDYLLVQVAESLRACIRESDVAARLGGDEFVVLISGLPHNGNAAMVAQKIIQSISRSYFMEEHSFYTSPSIGISLYPDDGQDVTTLMKCADAAMYQAKSEGGNNFKFFNAQLHVHSVERLTFENDLRRALEKNEFQLYYHPQVAANGQISGAEALIRWNHSQRGILLPENFLDVASQSGLILEIGKWTLETACRQFMDWRNRNINLNRMTVNLSLKEFYQDNLADTVCKITDATGVLRSEVELEISESSVMKNPDKSVGIISSLKSSGLRVSMDDFGRGYSSLYFLARFPIDQLKIDRSFILSIQNDKTVLSITISAIELARKLGIEVVASGVETKAQSKILLDQGCAFQQGYLFSKPVPAAEFMAFLSKQALLKTA